MAALLWMPGAMERAHDNLTVTLRSCLRRAWLLFFEQSDSMHADVVYFHLTLLLIVFISQASSNLQASV